jgi:hypothetical protein
MENLQLPMLGTTRCDHLRWKGLFVDAAQDPAVEHVTERSYWCLKTQICFGPDGQPVSESDCTPGRPCYKPL